MTQPEEGIQQSSIFLVSGGARGITAQCVRVMAARFGCRFILLGRSEFAGAIRRFPDINDERTLKLRIADELAARGETPRPNLIKREYEQIMAWQEIADTLNAVKAAGGEAEYVRADVADGPALSAALEPVVLRCGPVTGLIHGAGVVADKRIEKKTASEFRSVFAPKVHGLENLLACVAAAELQYLVLFSSVAGFFGNVGQSDYAMANEALDKAAHEFGREHPNCRVLSVNWGPWEGGMVTPEVRNLFAASGVNPIPLKDGAELLTDLLAAPEQSGQVVAGNALPTQAVPLGPELQTHVVSRRLVETDNLFLADHVIGPSAVLPWTCSASWVADACEQLYPGYRAFRWNGAEVLRGIVFDDGLADSYRLHLSEVRKDDADGEVEFAVMVASTIAGRDRFHYRGGLVMRRELPDPPRYENAYSGDGFVISGEALYRDGTLFHGPSFQGVQRVLRADEQGLTMVCRLPAFPLARQGQFPARTINPFVTDTVLQGLLIWFRRFRGRACLPLSMTAGEHYATLRFDQTYHVAVEVRDCTDQRLRADVIAYDDEGRINLRFSSAEVVASQQLDRFFAGVSGQTAASGR